MTLSCGFVTAHCIAVSISYDLLMCCIFPVDGFACMFTSIIDWLSALPTWGLLYFIRAIASSMWIDTDLKLGMDVIAKLS
jgi:hypothetical protein